MEIKHKVFSYALVVTALIVIIFGIAKLSAHRSISQPIDYNHKIHIKEAGMTCFDCHIYAEEMATATIPGIAVCQTCHTDQPISNSAEEAKVLLYVNEQKEIPWVKIYKLPDHVYFSHRRHVTDGNLDCSVCHGNIAEQTKPVLHQAVPITMENCMNCHEQKKVSNDCLSCHY